MNLGRLWQDHSLTIVLLAIGGGLMLTAIAIPEGKTFDTIMV